MDLRLRRIEKNHQLGAKLGARNPLRTSGTSDSIGRWQLITPIGSMTVERERSSGLWVARPFTGDDNATRSSIELWLRMSHIYEAKLKTRRELLRAIACAIERHPVSPIELWTDRYLSSPAA